MKRGSGIKWSAWQPQKVKAYIVGRIVENMYDACQFVAGKAEALVPVLTGLMKSEIDFWVKVAAYVNVVEGVVGVKFGEAFYARFIEFGTKKRPAQPFLRPAVFNNARKIVRIIMGMG